MATQVEATGAVEQLQQLIERFGLISSAQKARVATMYRRKEDGSLESMPSEMPQRPEFFMGGGALFSTPRDYIAFLQMLLNDGTFNGAQVLKPETGADASELRRHEPQMGALVRYRTEPGPAGRSAGGPPLKSA